MRTLTDATIFKYNINKYCYPFSCNQTEEVCCVAFVSQGVYYSTCSLLDGVSNKERVTNWFLKLCCCNTELRLFAFEKINCDKSVQICTGLLITNSG